MTTNIVFFLGLFLFLTGCFNQSKTTSLSAELAAFVAPDHGDQVFKKMAPLFQQTIHECPEKIWPGAHWDAFNLLLVKPETPALLWKAKNNSFQTLAPSAIPEANYGNMFEFVDWLGDRLLVMAPELLEESPETIFGVGYHEAFHQFIQKDWPAVPSSRGTTYPVSYVPRYYRYMMFQNLKKYFLSQGKDELDLQQAAYWHQKWKSEFPSEVKVATDGYEGTARYAEWVALAVTEKGCGASEEDLFKSIKELSHDKDFGKSLEPIQFALDGEGYDVGGVAAFILRFVKKNKTWMDQVAHTSPLDILLNPVAPSAQPDSSRIASLMRVSETRLNREYENTVGASISRYNDKKYVRVALNGQATALSTEKFYLPKVLSGASAFAITNPLDVSGLAWQVRIQPKTVVFNPTSSPCPATVVAVLPRSAVASERLHRINSDGLRGSLSGQTTKDHEGYTWLCTQ